MFTLPNIWCDYPRECIWKLYITHNFKNWNITQKLCTVFSINSLTPHLTFNEKKEKILGFVDIAGGRKMRYSDHALVFILSIFSISMFSMASECCILFLRRYSWSSGVLKHLKEIGDTSYSYKINSITGLMTMVQISYFTFKCRCRWLREDSIKMRNIQGYYRWNFIYFTYKLIIHLLTYLTIFDNNMYFADRSINISECDLSIFYDLPYLLKAIRNIFLRVERIYLRGKDSIIERHWIFLRYIY